MSESKLSPWGMATVEDIKARGRAANTVEQYRSDIGQFERFLATEGILTPPGSKAARGAQKVGGWGFDVSRWGKPMMLGFLAHLRSKYQAPTITVMMSPVACYLDVLTEDYQFPEFDLRRWRARYMASTYKETARQRAQREEVPSVPEVQEMLWRESTLATKAAGLFLAKTGCRINSAVALTWGQVNFDKREFNLTQDPATRDNKRSFFWAIMDDELSRVLLAMHKASRSDSVFNMSYKSMRGKVGRMMRRVVPDAHPHMFRHVFTHELRSRGMMDWQIQYLRGDVGAAAINTYTHPSQSHAQIRAEYEGHMPRLLVPPTKPVKMASKPLESSTTP